MSLASVDRSTGDKELGRRGEAQAAAFLRAAGYRLLVANYRCRLGEIDLVCEQGAMLVFVEVKTRRTCSHGAPQEAVDARKQAQVLRCAQVLLAERNWWHRPCRFDVMAVRAPADPDGDWHFEHLVDAFGMP